MFVDAGSANQKLNEILSVIETAQKLAVAVGTFATVGLSSIALAGYKVYTQVRNVNEKVEPVRHEITDKRDDTLANRIDAIVSKVSSDQEVRERQHKENSTRLERLEDRMDHLQTDVGDIRRVLDKILTKLAGLT